MPYKKYLIRPLKDGLIQNIPSIYSTPTALEWPAKNFRIDQNSVKKRQGYLEDRDLGSEVHVQTIALFQISTGSRYTLYLTPTDACKRESGGTWSYITTQHTGGTVSGISGAVITGSNTDWVDGTDVTAPAIGDYFIMDTDHSSTAEPDVNWGKIKSIGSDTQITLVDSYTGATSSGNYTIRKQYSVPSGERWQHAIVGDKFCFTCGGNNVQYYAGSTAADLDSTNAKKARYCLPYANRLFLADFYISTTRYPFSVKWSDEGDPTAWTGATSGSVDFIESLDFLTGLGQVGPNIMAYRQDSYKIGHRTGVPSPPVAFPKTITGPGLVAPYSLAHVGGSNVFVGRDDFYRIDAEEAIPVGGAIRNKFFSLIGETEVENTYSYSNILTNEVRFFATDTDDNRVCVVWNYKEDKWYYYDYNDAMLSGGRGEA